MISVVAKEHPEWAVGSLSRWCFSGSGHGHFGVVSWPQSRDLPRTSNGAERSIPSPGRAFLLDGLDGELLERGAYLFREVSISSVAQFYGGQLLLPAKGVDHVLGWQIELFGDLRRGGEGAVRGCWCGVHVGSCGFL
jgi:hypothetical protein